MIISETIIMAAIFTNICIQDINNYWWKHKFSPFEEMIDIINIKVNGRMVTL